MVWHSRRQLGLGGHAAGFAVNAEEMYTDLRRGNGINSLKINKKKLYYDV
jgi:hypothetical protein